MRKGYFFILMLFYSIGTSAQWTSNTAVNTEASNARTGDCRTLGTTDGKTWMVYFKSIPAPNYYEVRAQLLDKDGVPLLGAEGMLVNNAPHPSFTTVFSAITDASNNLIVGVANSSTNIIYINKVSPAGIQVWNSGGTVITGGIVPKLCALTNGDIIVSWLASSPAIKAPMQRLDAATGNPVWAAPVTVATVNAAHRSAPGNILPVAGNGFIHVFHNRATSSISSTLWAQRYDENGVAQWAAPVQLANKITAYNKEYTASMHKDTLFIGYDGATGLRIDGYVQRLNPDGAIPWGINGIDFATDNTYYEQNIKVAIAPDSNAVWAVSTITTTSQGSQGVYVQKFNKTTGQRLFTDNGKMVFPVAATPFMTGIGISLFADNSPLLLMGKYNSAISQFLYAAKLNASGNFAWTGDTLAVGTFPASKLRMTLTNVADSQAVAGWVETKSGFDKPYAQPIRWNGTTGLAAPVSSFTANNRAFCINNSVQFTNTSTGYITGYSWSFPGGNPSTSSDPNPLVVYNTSGVFNATLTTTNAGGSSNKTQTNYITVFANPAISAGPDKVIIDGDVVTLNGSGINNPALLEWTPAATLTGANTYTPVAKTSTTTTYTLNIKDNNGCSASDNTLVTVIPYCVKVMSAFTPNADGINDKWLVTNGASCSQQIIAKVFNRYGSLVYSNDHYNNDWDGKYQGKPVPDGTYYYLLQFKLINGKTVPLKGDVTILR